MTPITITVGGKCVDGYFYASFAGIWVVHPASNGKAFSQIRGFAPEVQAARVLRTLAMRPRGLPCGLPPDVPADENAWHQARAAATPREMDSAQAAQEAVELEAVRV